MNEAVELIEDLQILLDINAPPAQRTIDVNADRLIDQVQFLLKQEFKADKALRSVAIAVEGDVIGNVTRGSLARSMAMAGEPSVGPPDVGVGDRLTMPGESTRYRILVFECGACDSIEHRMYYDGRDLPGCVRHGRMRFVR